MSVALDGGAAQPGARYAAEIREQPEALLRLLEHRAEIVEAARALRRRRGGVLRIVAHGSSDNAASYGVYALTLLAGVTAFRDSISLLVYYAGEHDFRRSTVLALSQSGRTPDVVEYVEQARGRGALTIAVTNEPESALADAADIVVPLAAGSEHAVAATKTYTNQLAALALLGGELSGRGNELADDIRRTAGLLADSLTGLEHRAAALAVPFSFVGRMFVVGRGFELCTAREVALKLTETCRVAAESLSATDLSHGPVAALDPLFPVWAIVSRDESLPAVLAAVARAREAGATIVASGNASAEVEGAAYALNAPAPPRPLLAPLLSVVPGQLFAGALARVKGLDPDRPVGLTKVTLAR